MLDPRFVRQQIENLKIAHPELLEDDEAWIATLESETNFEDLLTSVVRRVDDTEALYRGTGDRIQELTARKSRFADRIISLRNLAFRLMQAAEIAKVELPLATLSLRAGQQQLVGDADPAELPDELCKISRELNRTAIKAELKAGRSVPGFTLNNAPPSLTIRVK